MRRTGKKQIIFALLLFSAGFLTLRAEVALPGKVFLEREYSHGQDEAFLRLLIRQTESLARMSGAARPEEALSLRIRAAGFRLLPGKKKRICEIPGTSAEWEKDDSLRGKIALLFLCRSFSFLPEEWEKILTAEELPFWLTSAVDRAMKGALAEGVYMHSNRDLFSLRNLIAATGRLPSFGVLTAMPEELTGKSERSCFREEAQVLAEIFCRKRMMKDYLADLIAGRSPTHWSTRFPSADLLQRDMTREARLLLWNRFSPLPARFLEKEIPSLKEILVPVNEETESGSWKNLPVAEAAALMTPENPHSPRLRKILAEKCRAFGAQASPEIGRASRNLAAAAEKLDATPETLHAYLNALHQTEQTVAREKEREAFFQREAHRALPLLPLWQTRFQALEADGAAMSDAVETFLKEAEKAYLSEY